MFSIPIWISSNYQTLLQFSEKQVKNLNKFFVKYTQILFIIYLSFLKIFSKIFRISPNFLQLFPLMFSSKSQQILLKTNTFLKFLLYFLDSSPVLYWHFIKFFPNFSIFFRFTRSFNKITVEIRSNFYFGLLKNFLAGFRSAFKFFFVTQIIFLPILIVSNFICLNFFILRFVTDYLFTKIPVFSKFVPKFHKFYLKLCQVENKIYPKLRKDFFYLYLICVFFQFRENLLKTLINYFGIEFVNKKIILLMHYPSLVHSAFSDCLKNHLRSLSNPHIFQYCANFPTFIVGNA